MKKYILYFAVGLSLCLSIVCLYRTYPSNAGFDYLGVIVGVLALLVTILLGWNIYSLIDFNHHKMDVVKLKNEIQDGLHRNMAITEGSLWMVYHYLLLHKDPLGLEYRFIQHSLASLSHASHVDDIPTCNAIVRAILECVTNPRQVIISEQAKSELLLLFASIKQPVRIQNIHLVAEVVALLSVKKAS